MSNKIRLALIGAGAMGRHHLKVALANTDIQVVGVSDPTEAARREATALGLPAFADHLQMLDETSPDGVVISAPNSLHAPLAVDCLDRGVATLIEKPVADSLEGARRIIESGKRTGAAVLVGHHRRHNPVLTAAADHVRDGGLGQVTAVNGMWLRRKPDAYYQDQWKLDAARGGGVLLINAIHDIDCLRMICGDITDVCAASSSATRNLPVEDTAAAVFRFRNGALGTFIVSDSVVAPWCWEMTSREDPRFAHVPENSYIICGTDASLAVPSLERWSNAPDGGRDAAFVRQRLYHVPQDSMTLQMQHFVRVIRGQELPLIDGDSAMQTLAVTLAISLSQRDGGWINVEHLIHQVPD